MDSHLAIFVVTAATMITMILQTRFADSMGKRMKKSFMRGYGMILLCAFLDYCRIAMDGSTVAPIWLHGFVVSLEYSCAPFIVLIMIGMLGELRRTEHLVYLLLFNVLLQMTTGYTGWLFYINDANYFVRGEWFRIYVAIYSIAIFVMYYEVYLCSKVYQNCNGVMLLSSIISLTVIIGMNEILGGGSTTFLGVAIASVMFYIYFVDINLQTDPLTRLLNRRCYTNHLKKLDYPTALVMFDVNKFKGVNDTCGHDVGDMVLKNVAKCLRSSFGGVGYVYRLGGDEFCLILHKNMLGRVSMETLKKTLDGNLAKYRQTLKVMPSVSMGYAVYDVGQNINSALNEADHNMYVNKNGRSDF